MRNNGNLLHLRLYSDSVVVLGIIVLYTLVSPCDTSRLLQRRGRVLD